jgi:hypothetical protein
MMLSLEIREELACGMLAILAEEDRARAADPARRGALRVPERPT